MWLAQPEVGEAHATALEAQTRLMQQLTDMTAVSNGPSTDTGPSSKGPTVAQAQQLLSTLPMSTRAENLWTRWQQALAAHDLRLQFLQPMPSSDVMGRGAALVSHVAGWRVVGRFDDWVRVWAACADSGPVCAIERISVVATPQAGEVEIDAVMRVWMRPAEALGPDQLALADWLANGPRNSPPAGRWRTALFAPSPAAADTVKSGRADGLEHPTRAVGATAGVADLPDDPEQWPLARLSLAGVWQQGADRRAVLSAGSHVVRVSIGQRVTLEGHRVVAIHDKGVHLRLGQGPLHPLTWSHAPPEVGSRSPLVEPWAGTTPPGHTSGGTTGSPTP
jgi:hypothetical protein